MYFQPNSKIVFIGDSITDAGRDRNQRGEGMGNALGSGYVALLNAQLLARFPEHRLRIVNQGVGGNTVRDLAARWQADVLDLKPTYLSIMIGINDVWRQFDSPLLSERQVHLDEYAQTLETLIVRTAALVKGVILITPYMIEANLQDRMRARMDEYADVVRTLAKRHSCPLVDAQAAFDDFLVHFHSAYLAWDRIHPNLIGHQMIADAFFKVVTN